VLAYKDDKARNTVMTGALRPQLDTALETLAAYDKPLVLMLYAGRYTASPLLPSTAYVRSVVDVGLDYLRRERIAGLVAYGVQIDGGLAQFDELKARIGRGRLALAMADHVPAPARSYAQAGQTVRVVPEVERVTLTFSHRDRRGTGAVTGSHQKQLLVDGKIVWREEVGAETGTWQTTTVDLTAAARGRSTVRITFRLTSISPIVDSAVDLAVDELRGVGLSIGNPRFEDGSAWQITRSGPYYVAAVDVYDPERPRRTFELLQQRFALFTDDLTIR
jgi:hypothetical protein